VLVDVAIVNCLVLALLMERYASLEKRNLADRPELLKDQRGLFPPPRLQQDPAAELAEVRREEAAALNAYGWVDPKAHVARIPIDRAIEILAKKGLPTRDG